MRVLLAVAGLCAFLTCSSAMDGQHDVQLLGAGTPVDELHPAVAQIRSAMAERTANWAGMVKKGGEELAALMKGNQHVLQHLIHHTCGVQIRLVCFIIHNRVSTLSLPVSGASPTDGAEAADEKQMKASQANLEAETRKKEQLDGIALEAGQKLIAANENVAKAKLHNSLEAHSPLRAVLSNPHAWIKDPDACEPVPACLHASMVGGGCNADKFPIDVCLNARKGEVNLCRNSVSVQENCCVTCMLEQDQACMKEKLILAGFDHDADPATVPASKIHKFDKECEAIESKLESEKSVPGVTNVGNYQALAQNLYTQQQAPSPPMK